MDLHCIKSTKLQKYSRDIYLKPFYVIVKVTPSEYVKRPKGVIFSFKSLLLRVQFTLYQS